MSFSEESPIYRVGLLQRIVPSYRAGFFSLFGQTYPGNFSLFAGDARAEENVHAAGEILLVDRFQAKNVHLFRGKFYFCWQSGLMRWLRSWDPEVLVLEANPRYLHSRQAMGWMKRRKRPVVGWGLGTGGKLRADSVSGKQWKQYLSHFDGMIAYSQSGAEEYVQLGVEQAHVFVAPNAVMPRPQEIPERNPDFSADGPIFLYVGRLQKRKKIDELILACGEVSKHTRLQLWIVGDGPEQEGLKILAEEKFPQAKFWGALHGKDVAPLFQQADAFVLPGTGGLAIQEAMFYGLPVIVAEADGTQSNLVRPVNGWLIGKENGFCLVDAIQEATKSAGQLREMGKVSFSIVQDEVNLEKMVQVFKSAIETVRGEKAL